MLALLSSLLITACGATNATTTNIPTTATPTAKSGTSVSPTPTDIVTVPIVSTTPNFTATPTPNPNSAHTIAIDPGHGGIDWGTYHTDANGKIDLKESTVVLNIGLKTEQLLEAQGYKVVMTRTDDNLADKTQVDLNGDGTVDPYDDLQARVNTANAANADLFLSIHVNSSAAGNDAGGVETWYCRERPFATDNQRFAELIQKESVIAMKNIGYDVTDRGANDDLLLSNDGTHIFVLGPMTKNHSSTTNMPGALTEALFITNDQEAAILNSSQGVDAFAGAYVKAINEYFNSSVPATKN